MFFLKRCCTTLALAGALAAPLSAQEPYDPSGLQMTREQLEAALAEYEQAANSPGYSSDLRERAEREAELVRERLEQGDFQVGDRIVLYVRGEPEMSDTLTVEPQQVVMLHEIGAISLQGVLRAELEEHMRTELARYVRDPQVTAESLIRVAILGAVGRPGFFVLPASMLLEDALMAAGGPSGNANLEKINVLRGDEVVWDGEELQQAMIDGRTLDQLNLRAGDQVDVPEERSGSFFSNFRNVLFFVTPIIAILTRVL